MSNVTLTGDYSTDVKALLELLRDSAESLVVSCQLLESSESVVDRHHAKQNLERWTPIWCDLDRNRGREVQPAAGDQVTCRHRLADARNKHIASGYFCVECGAAFAAADQAAPPAAAHGQMVAVVGTVPDGSGFKSLDFKFALESLPDGTRLYAAAHGDEAARKDAERYRWFRDNCQDGGLCIAKSDGFSLRSWSGDDPDRYIDAAMRAQGDGGEV